MGKQKYSKILKKLNHIFQMCDKDYSINKNKLKPHFEKSSNLKHNSSANQSEEQENIKRVKFLTNSKFKKKDNDEDKRLKLQNEESSLESTIKVHDMFHSNYSKSTLNADMKSVLSKEQDRKLISSLAPSFPSSMNSSHGDAFLNTIEIKQNDQLGRKTNSSLKHMRFIKYK